VPFVLVFKEKRINVSAAIEQVISQTIVQFAALSSALKKMEMKRNYVTSVRNFHVDALRIWINDIVKNMAITLLNTSTELTNME